MYDVNYMGLLTWRTKPALISLDGVSSVYYVNQAT